MAGKIGDSGDTNVFDCEITWEGHRFFDAYANNEADDLSPMAKGIFLAQGRHRHVDRNDLIDLVDIDCIRKFSLAIRLVWRTILKTSTMIDFTCDCGQKYLLDDKYAGQQVRCKACGNTTIVADKEPDVPVDQTREFTPTPPPQGSGQSTPSTSASSSADSGYGSHRILKEHARGGMGRISIALDQNLKREVALKELFEKTANNETAVHRFLDEAEITARLEHPGIVPIHAFGLDSQGRPFYTMKLIRGKTLQEAIKEFHRIPETALEKPTMLRELLRRFASVCQTMQFVHDRGILHRDLKPANIMLGEHGETLVMDWGLAKPIAEQDGATYGELAVEKFRDRPDYTESGNVIGTPAYMSPEQAAGDLAAMSSRSDVYSLGAVLYQVLTDETPYTGKSSDEIVQKVLRERPKPASEMNKFTPKALEAIAMKALSRNPSDRYADAGKLYRDVMNWLDDEPVSAKPDTRYEKCWRWMRKNRTLATTLFVAAFVVPGILGVSGMMLERARTEKVAAERVRDEMKLRAEAALELAAERERQLLEKEQELKTAYDEISVLAGDATEEREKLQRRINQLNSEISTLEKEIDELRALARSLDSSGNEEREPSKVLEGEMTRKLYETLAEIKRIEEEVFTVAAHARPFEERIIKLARTNREDTLQKLRKFSRESKQIKSRLKRARSVAISYLPYVSTISASDVYRTCDCIPFDWELIAGENGFFVGDFIREAIFELGQDRYYVNKNHANRHSPVFARKTCNNWIFAHANSRIVVDIPDGVDRFTAVGGVNQNLFHPLAQSEILLSNFSLDGTWTYQVWLDGKQVYESCDLLYYENGAVMIDIPITSGTKQMELIITSQGSANSDWSIWGWPMFHLKDREPSSLTEKEYREIRDRFPDLELPENMGDCSIIELSELTDANLRLAVLLAGRSPQSDLIVARTSEESDTVVLCGREIPIDIDASERGRLLLVGLGKKKLVLNAENKSKVFHIEKRAETGFANVDFTRETLDAEEKNLYWTVWPYPDDRDKYFILKSPQPYEGIVQYKKTEMAELENIINIAGNKPRDYSLENDAKHYVGHAADKDMPYATFWADKTKTYSIKPFNGIAPISYFCNNMDGFELRDWSTGAFAQHSEVRADYEETPSGDEYRRKDGLPGLGVGADEYRLDFQRKENTGLETTYITYLRTPRPPEGSVDFYLRTRFPYHGLSYREATDEDWKNLEKEYQDKAVKPLDDTEYRFAYHDFQQGEDRFYTFWADGNCTLSTRPFEGIEYNTGSWMMTASMEFGINTRTGYARNGEILSDFGGENPFRRLPHAADAAAKRIEQRMALRRLEKQLDAEEDKSENPVYHEVRKKYPELSLPETSRGWHVVELDWNAPEEQLRLLLKQSGARNRHTMIIARTTLKKNKIVLSGKELSINHRATEHQGRVVLASLGEEPLILDANRKSRVFHVPTGYLLIAGLVLTGGETKQNGGAILNEDLMLVVQSSIVGNLSGDKGGGLSNTGRMAVLSSKIHKNSTAPWHGGGCSNHGSLFLSNVFITENQSAAFGGGINNEGGSLYAYNCLISGNRAGLQCHERYRYGGAIASPRMKNSFIVNCTIVGNKSAEKIGGVHFDFNKGRILNTIITNNHAPENPNADSALYQSTDEKNNLIGVDAKFVVPPKFDGKGNITNLDKIDLRLRPGSPAIDSSGEILKLNQIDLAEFSDLIDIETFIKTDLNGNPRVNGKSIDIGAYEYDPGN